MRKETAGSVVNTKETLQNNREKKVAIRGWNFPWTSLVGGISIVAMACIYVNQTQLPRKVTIAGGPQNGRYTMLANGIAEELRHRFGIDVEVLETKGSLENLSLLETHQIDFAFYQPGTRQALEVKNSDRVKGEPASFVSNMYPELLIPVGAKSLNSAVIAGHVPNQIWSCNDRTSGDFAATRLLLQHLNTDESKLDIHSVSYVDLPDKLRSGEVSIGMLCCGLQAPTLRLALQPDCGKMLKIPAVEAMARKHTSLHLETIPAGYFSTSPLIPKTDFQTVAFKAQLLSDTDASVLLVEEVTRIVSDAGFQRRLGLTELFSGGTAYATDRPEYAIHAGASHVYNPGLKPLINPDFVEGTEGLRSFVVSLIAAVWLLHRWWSGRKIRSQEHRLDRYIKELLELERDQMDVDGEGTAEESAALQIMLDRVTLLRQEALSEFSAHELNEDRAVDCFIEMCHALSDKINAKLTRHCIAHSFRSPT